MPKVVWLAAGMLIIPSSAGLVNDKIQIQIHADNVITENLCTGMHVNKTPIHLVSQSLSIKKVEDQNLPAIPFYEEHFQ